MTDRLKRLNDFIANHANGSVPKAAAILGVSNGLLYTIRQGKAKITDDVMLRIENGHGEYRTRKEVGKQNTSNRFRPDFEFDESADPSRMNEAEIAQFVDAIERRIAAARQIIETAAEKARIATEEAEARIPALMEIGRTAVAELSKKQMAKFGAVAHKRPTVVTDDMRQAIAADTDTTANVAEKYGISKTTVKRIRRDA